MLRFREVFWRVEIANKMLRDNYVDLMVSVNKSDSKIEFFLNKRYQPISPGETININTMDCELRKAIGEMKEVYGLHCAHQVTYTSRFQKCEERVPIGQHRALTKYLEMKRSNGEHGQYFIGREKRSSTGEPLAD